MAVLVSVEVVETLDSVFVVSVLLTVSWEIFEFVLTGSIVFVSVIELVWFIFSAFAANDTPVNISMHVKNIKYRSFFIVIPSKIF